MLVVQLEGADERCAELIQKVQRSAEKGDMAADRLAAGETGDRLVHNRLKDGGGKVFSGGSLVDQRLDIGLGKDTAARGDRINRLVILGVFVQSCGIGLDQGCHLVDK